MVESSATCPPSTTRVILVPAAITLAITALRLMGELQHWSKALFNPEAGGLWAIVGITWLAFVFGIYFAVRLVYRGQGPASAWKAIGVSVLGWVILFVSRSLAWQFIFPRGGFKASLVFLWVTWALAGILQIAAWPSLFNVLVAYSFAARLPVAVVMFLAFQGHWGTHYDALPPGWVSMGPLPDFLWLRFFPQLTFWVGFTMVAGMLLGSIAAALTLALRRAPDST